MACFKLPELYDPAESDWRRLGVLPIWCGTVVDFDLWILGFRWGILCTLPDRRVLNVFWQWIGMFDQNRKLLFPRVHCREVLTNKLIEKTSTNLDGVSWCIVIMSTDVKFRKKDLNRFWTLHSCLLVFFVLKQFRCCMVQRGSLMSLRFWWSRAPHTW